MLHPSFKVHLPKVIELLKAHKVKNACVFGSVLTADFGKESDVDFIVNLEEGVEPVEAGIHLWDLYDGLRDLLNREVDILTERSLKNPYFIQEVNNSKLPIYGY
ncbi:nucleotidyltransferase family protein [Pedobacter arcticus]|uniref:nucleotidyltransferase family protein n=1 Tax=Pedobacter arcticus TaxID=752140 RepID=UPI0002E53C40|nr:nucleotidyltransferase domain-containing protein [Pedobacter arcticus]